MDRLGPGIVVIAANMIVVVGAMLQAIAKGNDQLWLIFIGRLLLGFGGEITPFTTIEILGRLFPDYFGLMVGNHVFHCPVALFPGPLTVCVLFSRLEFET